MEMVVIYQILSATLFVIGGLGVIVKRDAIVQFMCLELMLNAANLSIVSFSNQLRSLDGHVYVFFVMAVAAAEAAVGLAIILSLFRHYVVTDVDEISSLRG